MRILCFGDSDTWGNKEIGVRYDIETRWTTVMGSLLGEDYTIIEDGLCGRTADSLEEEADRPRGFLQKAIVAAYPFDMIIISLGLGDLREELKFTAEDITANLCKIIKVILNYDYEDGKVPSVLLVSPQHIKEGVESSKNAYIYGLKESSISKSKELAPLYENLANELGILFFDAAKHIEAGKLDNWHLDEDGHKKLAHALAEFIKKQ